MKNDIIASRNLQYVEKGSSVKKNLVVKIHRPFELKDGDVSFSFDPGTAGCAIEYDGLGTDYYDHVVYGADTLQAIQLASNIEPCLKGISKKYDLYFETGEPYFE